MASDEHKIAAPLGIETIALRLNGDERAIHIMAWAEGAWPDYIAVQDRITGRVCTYRPIEGDEIGGGGFDEKRYRRVCRLLEDAIATMAAWGAVSDE